MILSLLHNLETFLREPGELDALIKMAVAHNQCEAIHLFIGGDGRTGRILNILVLLQAGLVDIPVLFLIPVIIQNKAEYYRRLRAVTENNAWEGWLLCMLTTVERTARWTTSRIKAICDLFEATLALFRKELPGTSIRRN